MADDPYKPKYQEIHPTPLELEPFEPYPQEPAEVDDTPAEVPLDAEGRVDAEVGCRACGYIIKSLKPEDDCPECGHPVADSLRGGVLRFADPRWLGQLWRGLMMIWVFGGSLIACGFLGWLLGVLISPYFLALWIIPPIILAVAVWHLTAQDPERSPEQQPRRAQWLGRVGALLNPVFLALAAVVPMIIASTHFSSGSTSNAISGMFGILGGIGGFDFLRVVAQTVAVVATMNCLIALARRIPSNGLAKQAKVCAWGFGVSGAVGLAGKALYIVVAALMIQQASSMSWLGGPSVTAPARPTTPALSTNTAYGFQTETWTHTATNGSTAILEIETDTSSNEQTWSETVNDANGLQLAYHEVYVDASGAATYGFGNGPHSALHYLQPQAAQGTANHPPASVVASSGTTATTASATNAVPALPSRPPDTVRNIGGVRMETWSNTQPDGTLVTVSNHVNADGSRTVTEATTSPSGAVTQTTTTLNPQGVVTNTHNSNMAMNVGGPTVTGGFMSSMLLMFVGVMLMLGGWLGFAAFLIWLVVLVFLFRSQLREAHTDASALHQPMRTHAW